ncbi:hypothetical protein OPIT5_04645 [Opitutaceae bacterium TAV5]|nr:hypothetical protein OPIT5_04645 [Opitutaceae bacterium TAV5]
MKRNIKSTKGFTLVEMLGVLAIIAILISVIAVGVMSAINRARIVATTANFKNIETAVVGYVALNTSGGTVPLTEASGTSASDGVPLLDGTNGVTYVADSSGYYTLNQVLISAGLLDNNISWRVGKDGLTQVNLGNEKVFRLSKVAFNDTSSGNPPSGSGNNWDDYNRAEACKVAAAGTFFDDADDPTTFGTTPFDDVAATGLNFLLDGKTPLKASRVAYVVLKGVSYKDATKLSQEINGALDDSEESPLEDQFKGRFIYQAGTDATDPVDCYYYLASF